MVVLEVLVDGLMVDMVVVLLAGLVALVEVLVEVIQEEELKSMEVEMVVLEVLIILDLIKQQQLVYR